MSAKNITTKGHGRWGVNTTVSDQKVYKSKGLQVKRSPSQKVYKSKGPQVTRATSQKDPSQKVYKNWKV